MDSTYRNSRADDEVVVLSEDHVVGALEAHMQLGRPVVLHVLQGAAGKSKSSGNT